jgi:hypothetical protein
VLKQAREYREEKMQEPEFRERKNKRAREYREEKMQDSEYRARRNKYNRDYRQRKRLGLIQTHAA